jgi:hypothetical protein
MASRRGGAVVDDEVPREHFSDEEMAFPRYARFGQLPPRIPPEERVEMVETEMRRDIPDQITPDEARGY